MRTSTARRRASSTARSARSEATAWSRTIQSRSSTPQASSQATDEEAPQDLSAVLAAFRKRLNDRGDIDPEEWRPYFIDHEQYDLWQAAEVRTRSALVELLDKDTAGELLEDIGGTMLDDPDIDVRLALLKALVRSGLKKAVTFIERRLDDIVIG